jgi:outer membrane protein assembly factor BamB
MDMAPVLGGTNDVLVIQNKRLVSFDLTGRRIGWERTGSYTGSIAVAAGRLYVFNNSQLEVRAESDGALLWMWIPPEGAPAGTAIVTDNLIFVSTAANTYAIDLASHQTVWRHAAGGLLALGQRGQLLIARADGKLTAIAVK